MESEVASIIQRAIDMDKKEQYTMALLLYKNGVQILADSIKDLKDPVRKRHFHIRAAAYMDRAERIKALIKERQNSGNYSEHMKIENGAVGHGYDSIFGRFLDVTVTQIRIEDPYIRTSHECQNFLKFCELSVQKCQLLSRISLTTTSDKNKNKKYDKNNQMVRLEELKKSLASRLVTLEVKFAETLHDKQIMLSNGWVIKIGRGLDYFKPPDGKFVLGYYDLELRPCLETMVDIYHRSQLEDNAK